MKQHGASSSLISLLYRVVCHGSSQITQCRNVAMHYLHGLPPRNTQKSSRERPRRSTSEIGLPEEECSRLLSMAASVASKRNCIHEISSEHAVPTSSTKGIPRMPDSHARVPACESTPATKPAPAVTAKGKLKEERKAKTKRRRHAPTRKREQEPGVLYLTQNVRGMLKETAALDSWLDGLRLRTEMGPLDVVLLQETRATEKWRQKLRRRYAAGWGLRAEEHLDQWSFWGPTPQAAAGVAILVRPGGRITNPRPMWEQHWSEWFIAVQFEVDGVTHTVANIYGPSDRSARESVFKDLATHIEPHGSLLVGGDFNCTLDDALDRSYATRHSHDSVELHELLRKWQLCDVLEGEQDQIVNEGERREFHAARHTYRYKLDDGELATSRLDRFYIDREHTEHIRQVEVITPVGESDHDGVLLFRADERQPPARRQRKSRRRIRYPLPYGSQDAVASISEQLLHQVVEHADAAPAITAHRWVRWKSELRQQCLRAIHTAAHKQTRSYRQRRRRLLRALRATLPATNSNHNSISRSVDGITRAFEGLTIDGYSRTHAIRAELVRLTKNRARRRRRERYATYAHGTPGAERAFFKRFHARQGQRLAAPLPTDPNRPMSPAERLAVDWSSITQRGDRESNKVHEFLDTLPAPAAAPNLHALDDPFTEEEVADAIAACPRRKAPGPDGIPNDWYRDHTEQLTPILTQLFNEWHRAGTLPVSFRKALVACIPKTTRPRTGLDYRPIALLDTDYKIYSRLLLNRLRPSLPELVAETQFGFVPGRQVHDALDVFHALQALVRDGQAPSSSLAISLDFAKAYDTLDRPFLLATLERLGCPTRFLQAVKQMHLATTAAYMADADISHEHQVLNGIRQGCPLAPTLFVLAVDTLYQAVSAHPEIPGIRLPDGDTVGPAGFADDTNIYVTSPDAMEPLFDLLHRFEEASGLGVNRDKCIAIALHDTERPTIDLGLPLAAPSDMNRLLGGQVSSQPVNSKTWELTLQQMRTRLRMAELKTTNVLQRIKLVKAVLVPKFTFVARHHWPSSDQISRVQQLVHTFVWHGSLAETTSRGRAWMNAAVAALPPKDGGLGLPTLRHVLQELSVQVISRWAAPNHGMRSAIGKIRLQHHKAPEGSKRASRREPTQPTLQSTLGGTGLQLHHALSTQPRAQDEIELATAALQHVGKGTIETHNWDNGWLLVDYTVRLPELQPLKQLQATRYGTLHAAALMAAPIAGEDILIGPDGLPIRPKDYAGLVPATGTIGGLIDIRWRTDGQMAFRCKTRAFPMPDAQARAFRRLCDVLVFNYPSLLRNPGPEDELITVIPSLDVWQLQRANGLIELWWSPVHGIRVSAGTVTSTHQAAKAARHLTSTPDLDFHRHVWLDNTTSLWRTEETMHSTEVRELLELHTRAASLDEIDERSERWRSWNPRIAHALDNITWEEILAIPDAPATQRLLLYRLKGNRIPGWSSAVQAVACPHCPDLKQIGGRADHIFWDCPHAQRLWRALKQRWNHLWSPSTRADKHSFLHNVFSLRLDTVPSAIWTHPEVTRLPKPTPEDTSEVHDAIQATWRSQVLATLYAIWRWRTNAEDQAELWTIAQARAYHDGCLNATLADPRWERKAHRAASCHTSVALEILRSTDPENELPATSTSATSDRQYILFFDGGSRGNPGPGGSGAVIVSTNVTATTSSIIWSAAMSSAKPTTTNNQAEYCGVLEGLRAAQAHQWTPLDVVGDSQIILGQLRKYMAPRNKRLREFYAEARRLGDQLGVRQWIHHLRAYNKMADTAANAAMDSRASSQVHHPTTRAEHANLAHHLASDFAQWQAHHFARLHVQ